MPGCRVIVDRRLGERRRVQAGWQADEQRRGDRRSSALEYSQGLVVLLRWPALFIALSLSALLDPPRAVRSPGLWRGTRDG